MKNIFLVFLLVAFLLPLPATARLGETVDELTKRYGKPIKIAEEYEPLIVHYKTRIDAEILPRALVWQVNSITIVAYIDKDNVCQLIDYEFDNKDYKFPDPLPEKKPDETILDLLEKNSNGYKWELYCINIRDFSLGNYSWTRPEKSQHRGHAYFVKNTANSRLTLYKGDLMGLCEEIKRKKLEKERQQNIEAMKGL